MDGDIGGASGSMPLVLAAVGWAGALLASGLMTAFFRVSALHKHGLLEPRSLGWPLREYLGASRRFLVTASTTFLALTALGVFAWGRLLAVAWPQGSGWRFQAALALVVVAAWTLGGLLVRRVAAAAPLGYARWLGIAVFPVHWLLRPWAALLLWLMDQRDDLLWAGEAMPHLSPGEIRSLLNDENGSVTLEEEEREMIQSIFGFHDTAVREIMIPRIDMVALEASDPVTAAVEVVNRTRHSRIPVHEGGVDRVTGILYAKDLLTLVDRERLAAGGKTVGELTRPAYYIPESKKIDEVLAEFRTKRIHMAIVIDEYGGTAGLVTLEDVMEEIVGEIEDEFDPQEKLFEWLDERTLRLDPKIDLEDLEELLGVELPRVEGAETLGGLIHQAAGRVPEEGDEFPVAGFTVQVERVADQRMLEVLLGSAEPLPGYARRGRDHGD